MTKNNDGDGTSDFRPDTRLVIAGRDPADYHGFVNPPVYHASTVLYPTAEDYLAHRSRLMLGASLIVLGGSAVAQAQTVTLPEITVTAPSPIPPLLLPADAQAGGEAGTPVNRSG